MAGNRKIHASATQNHALSWTRDYSPSRVAPDCWLSAVSESRFRSTGKQPGREALDADADLAPCTSRAAVIRVLVGGANNKDDSLWWRATTRALHKIAEILLEGSRCGSSLLASITEYGSLPQHLNPHLHCTSLVCGFRNPTQVPYSLHLHSGAERQDGEKTHERYTQPSDLNGKIRSGDTIGRCENDEG
jgi:hypothetical protein